MWVSWIAVNVSDRSIPNEMSLSPFYVMEAPAGGLERFAVLWVEDRSGEAHGVSRLARAANQVLRTEYPVSSGKAIPSDAAIDTFAT